MIERTQASPALPALSSGAGLEVPRVLGRYDTGQPGPLLVVLGGLHGNEPAGVRAACQVLAELESAGAPQHGRVVALAGNRGALQVGQRFLARDLNRLWLEEQITLLRARDPAEDDPEGREQRELLAALEREVQSWDGPLCLLDLHTTSAAGAPFSLAADTLQNRALAEHMPLPMVLGLEEGIEGPLLSYLADRGHPALVVEGGQHGRAQTETNLHAAIWIFLAVAGGLAEERPEVRAARRWLQRVCAGPPGVLEIEHVHHIQPGEDFAMLPDFENFQPIEVGQPLAHERRGLIRSPHRGLMLMPLYQDQGRDGYFLCSEIPRGWLRFSERCRRSGLETLLPSLPGVRVEHGRPRCLALDEDAPAVVRRVLRHFGYRRRIGPGLLQRRPERGEH